MDIESVKNGILAGLDSDVDSSVVEQHLGRCFTAQDQLKEDKNKAAADFLSWAAQCKHVKTQKCDVPPGILPVGTHGVLSDIRVQSRGPDDAVYDANKILRDKIARGNTFLTLEANGKKQHRCVIYALKKFTGGLGDDDDRDAGDNHTWKRYFTKPLESTDKVVCTRKANGEAAHLSARKIGDDFIVCCGSKNVHMLMKSRADLSKYTEPRYNVASQVAEAVWDVLDSLSHEHRQLLLSFLHLSEYTGIFEVLQPTYQHVEDLSHLKRPELRFITWTSCDVTGVSLCSLPPHVAIQIACSLHLPAISYTVIAFSDIDKRMAQVREGYGYEGEVLYFMDNNNETIGLLKKKTIWYIVCRAIREKVRTACGQYQKNPSTFSESRARTKIDKRIGEIKSWLGLDEEATQAWKDLGVGFLQWSTHALGTGQLQFRDVAEMFPVTWKKYLKETGQSDQIQAKWKEPEGSDE